MNAILAMAVHAALAALPSLIQAAEQIHGAGTGPTKHASVLDAVVGLVGHVPELRDDLQKLRGALSPVISSVVALMNDFGTLKAEGIVAAGPALVNDAVSLVRTAAGAVGDVKAALGDVAGAAGVKVRELELEPEHPKGNPAEGADTVAPHEREGADTNGGTVPFAASMGG